MNNNVFRALEICAFVYFYWSKKFSHLDTKFDNMVIYGIAMKVKEELGWINMLKIMAIRKLLLHPEFPFK